MGQVGLKSLTKAEGGEFLCFSFLEKDKIGLKRRGGDTSMGKHDLTYSSSFKKSIQKFSSPSTLSEISKLLAPLEQTLYSSSKLTVKLGLTWKLHKSESNEYDHKNMMIIDCEFPSFCP